ncbi:AsmA family protein [Roseovarius sp. EGI FJ00037]|uniref:AsmA family protein n=2 Tax=Roseovarius TaxID=74030 RepID=UPI0022A66A52|nr:AsmA-like C-terminal region-containing protein [Roseovarius sp. EGI FJ00037]MCZ0810740.1 AsmA family protein [Roseovarius sp. EGI FJ00037]
MSESQDMKPRGARARRVLPWVVSALVALVIMMAVAVSLAAGREFVAPEWLRDKISQKINDDLSGFSLRFGEVALVVESDWVPRLSLHDVTLRDPSGATLVSLSRAQSRVALGPLLKGALQPAEINLSGARVTLWRSKDGAVGLSVGDTALPLEEAANMGALAAQLDAVLERPHFAALREVEASNLTLRYEDARADRAWNVDDGRLEMTREGDRLTLRGDVALLGARAYATTLAMNYTREIGETAADFGVTFEDMPARDIAGQSPALTWLGALDAPISGSLRASVDETGRLGQLNATLQIAEGVLQPTEATEPVAFSQARVYFSYDPAQHVLRFDEISVDSKWVSALAEGRAYLVGMESGWPSELLGQFQFRRISANPDGMYPEPIEVESAVMDMRLRIDPFLLTLGQLSLRDESSRLVMKGALEAEPEGWTLALDATLDALQPDRLLTLWPEGLAKGARAWIDKNVTRADLSNLQFAARFRPDHDPDVFLGFDYENLDTVFIRDVPPIEAAAGHASLIDSRFVITTDRGHVTAAQGGRIDISGTSFMIPDVNIDRGPAGARLKTDSTITAALSLLDEGPFGFMTKANLPVTLADGRAQMSGQLDFLLKNDLSPDEVAFSVNGRLSDLRSETLVPGRVLAASGLDLHGDNAGISVSGEGRIGGVPVEGQWRTALGEESDGTGRVTGSVELSERFADEFRIGLPPGSLSGAGRANIEITLPPGEPGRFEMRSDLSGVGLSVPQLSWALGTQATGDLQVAGTLGEPPKIDSITLDAAGLEARGAVTLNDDGTLSRAVFSRVRLGTWLDAPVELQGRGAGRAPQVLVSGGMVDLRQTSLAGDGSGGGGANREGGPVSLALDRLIISDGIVLRDFRADLDMSGGASGSFTGQVNGGPQVTGRVAPKDGRSAFQIRSQDAGAVLAAAGMLRQARDGEMNLVLVPVSGAGRYEGSLEVKNVRLTDAPALAALLNTVSVVGLLDQLSGEGIHFSEVTSRFLLTPRRVTLMSGSAVGASMGVSMEGYYDLESTMMDMQGVVSPFYLVNSAGGLFTRRGEGLVGMTYTMRGPVAQPSVSVNPLSVFTPGMFRNLFRRPPPGGGGSDGLAPERQRQQRGGGEAGQ